MHKFWSFVFNRQILLPREFYLFSGYSLKSQENHYNDEVVIC